MKIATILSNFNGISAERFFDEYVYQIMVLRDITKNNRLNIYPVSIDTSYEQAFNGFSQFEKNQFKPNVREIHESSNCILICIDRDFTPEMESIVLTAIEKNNADILFYTLFPNNSQLGSTLEVFNNDEYITSLRKIELVKQVIDKLKTNNRLIYRQFGDLTNYRQKFLQEVVYTEEEMLLTFAAALEKKISRDTVSGDKVLANNPFQVLKNIRQQVLNRKAS